MHSSWQPVCSPKDMMTNIKPFFSLQTQNEEDEEAKEQGGEKNWSAQNKFDYWT